LIIFRSSAPPSRASASISGLLPASAAGAAFACFAAAGLAAAGVFAAGFGAADFGAAGLAAGAAPLPSQGARSGTSVPSMRLTVSPMPVASVAEAFSAARPAT